MILLFNLCLFKTIVTFCGMSTKRDFDKKKKNKWVNSVWVWLFCAIFMMNVALFSMLIVEIKSLL